MMMTRYPSQWLTTSLFYPLCVCLKRTNGQQRVELSNRNLFTLIYQHPYIQGSRLFDLINLFDKHSKIDRSYLYPNTTKSPKPITFPYNRKKYLKKKFQHKTCCILYIDLIWGSKLHLNDEKFTFLYLCIVIWMFCCLQELLCFLCCPHIYIKYYVFRYDFNRK